MGNELRELVVKYLKETGVKKAFLAAKVGLTPTKFSLWLHCRSELPMEKEAELKQYIEAHTYE